MEFLDEEGLLDLADNLGGTETFQFLDPISCGIGVNVGIVGFVIDNNPINQSTDTSGSNNFESVSTDSLNGTTILEVLDLVNSQIEFLVVSLDQTLADIQRDDINTVNLDGNTLVDSVLTPGLGVTLSDLNGKDTISGADKVKVSLLIIVKVLALQGLEVRITPGVANLSRSSLDLDTSTSSSPFAGTQFLESQNETSGAFLGSTEGRTSASNHTLSADDTLTTDDTSTFVVSSASNHTLASNDFASSDHTSAANNFYGTFSTAANSGTATYSSNDSAGSTGYTGTAETALFDHTAFSGSEDTAATDSSLGSLCISNREAQGSN